MKVRICPSCGTHNPENAWVCECGHTLSVNTLVDLDPEPFNKKTYENVQSQKEPEVDRNPFRETNVQKWKYARLRSLAEGKSGVPLFSKGKITEQLSFMIYGDPTSHKEYGADQLGQLMAWLGNDGWELVSVNDTFAQVSEVTSLWITVWYFKKPIN